MKGDRAMRQGCRTPMHRSFPSRRRGQGTSRRVGDRTCEIPPRQPGRLKSGNHASCSLSSTSRPDFRTVANGFDFLQPLGGRTSNLVATSAQYSQVTAFLHPVEPHQLPAMSFTRVLIDSYLQRECYDKARDWAANHHRSLGQSSRTA